MLSFPPPSILIKSNLYASNAAKGVDPRPTMVYTICLCEPKIISEANNVQEVDNLKKTIIII